VCPKYSIWIAVLSRYCEKYCKNTVMPWYRVILAEAIKNPLSSEEGGF
jgi:hypothetical protein